MNKARVRKSLSIVDSGINSLEIFDSSDTSDVPDSVMRNITKKKISFEVIVSSLFDIKPELSIDEIVLGLWRKYELEVSRIKVQHCLHNLKAKKFLRVVGRKLYIKEGVKK